MIRGTISSQKKRQEGPSGVRVIILFSRKEGGERDFLGGGESGSHERKGTLPTISGLEVWGRATHLWEGARFRFD